jgi:hypothetical protein
MKTNKNPPRLPATATLVLIAIAAIGCSDVRKERLEAARIAFDSLPDTEVVSADAKTGLVTIRSRATGQVAVVDVMRAGGARPAWEVRSSDANPAPVATAGDAGENAVARQGISPAETAAAASAEAGTGSAAPDQPAPAAATGGRRPLAAVVTRDGAGRIERLEGPGFSVARTGGDARAPAADSAADAAHAGSGRSNTARRETTAIVCGPGERREVQNIELDVPGAGIVAQPGCDLRIANTRVRAGGWGLVVAAGATVRLDSTVIEGSTGSVDLAPGGTLSASASTFRGAGGPPTAAAGYVDRGGNAWN